MSNLWFSSIFTQIFSLFVKVKKKVHFIFRFHILARPAAWRHVFFVDLSRRLSSKNLLAGSQHYAERTTLSALLLLWWPSSTARYLSGWLAELRNFLNAPHCTGGQLICQIFLFTMARCCRKHFKVKIKMASTFLFVNMKPLKVRETWRGLY